MNFSEVFNLEQLIVFVVIFFICSVGAIARDVFDGFKGKVRINVKVILLSSLVVSILLWCTSDFFLDRIDLKLFFGLTVILGMLSYEITGKLTSINGIKSLIKDYIDFKGKLQGGGSSESDDFEDGKKDKGKK